MKVILNQTVPKLGKEGQVVNVADGFARNFLFPKQLARMADKANIALLEREKARQEEQAEKSKGAAEKLAGKLSGATVRITATTAKGSYKLFGAVTSSDIAEAIKNSLKIEVDKRNVALLHPIKRLGVYDVMIDLHREVDANIKVEVADETGNLGLEVVSESLPPEAAEQPGGEAPAAEPSPEA
jgi:large subunit ribosomal protein L9